VEDLTKEFVAESREGLERMELCLTELEQRHGDSNLIGEIFRVVHTIKGTTGFLGFGRLQTLAHAGESLLAALRDGRIAVSGELISGLLELRDGLQTILEIIETRGSEGERHDDDDRELIAWMKELEGGGRPNWGSRPATSQHGGDGHPASNRSGESSFGAQNDSQRNISTGDFDRTLRIEVEALDRMMNLVGDLVLTRNRMLQCQPGDGSYAEQVRRLNTVTAELRQSVMQARMQPVGHLFAKFPRMVRDLALQCGRKVRIEFEGQETALDKSLLEAVRDPLTHAVRNAVDHGIEPEDERVRAGKRAEGMVRLKAYSQNGWVVIEVTDDGAGISAERVLAKAVERGLVKAEAAETITEAEAQQLIFAPGFSTAKEVTSISGRGVGMDVVRTNVEQAGGRVEVESRAGLGTTLRLRVPLTLAIVPALVVECAGESFALPQASLVELVHVPATEAESAVERIGTTELYRLRDRLLPLVRLARVLELEDDAGSSTHISGSRCGVPTAADRCARGFYIVVLEPEGRRFGLMLDGLRPPEEIVVKPLPASLREIGIYAGTTVLGNGSLAMILDAAAIGDLAGLRAAAEGQLATAAGAMAADGQTTTAGAEAIAMENAMVIYEPSIRDSGDIAKRMAVPLSAVERIATVPLREVEDVDGRAMLQYDGDVIPLEDDGGVLGELRAARSTSATVLICTTRERRRVGVVVRRVVDVCPGELLLENTALCTSPLARVKERITAVHRDFAMRQQCAASGRRRVLEGVA